MTKSDRIRALLTEGRDTKEIAHIVGTSLTRVEVVRWLLKNPSYKAQWMARKRLREPDYYARELEQQREYSRRKRAIA